jgi:hypothetical protein
MSGIVSTGSGLKFGGNVKWKPDYIVAVTGHREGDLSLDQRHAAGIGLEQKLSSAKQRYGDGLLVLSGMASGVDQYAANICIRLGIKFTACVPHKDYFSNYGMGDSAAQGLIHGMLDAAYRVVYVCDALKFHWKMNLTRNEYMLRYCNAVLACAQFDLTDVPLKGGTAHMCRIAQAAEKPIVLIRI